MVISIIALLIALLLPMLSQAREQAYFVLCQSNHKQVALATVIDRGDPVWEIGMEVTPVRTGRGLGRAVVAAAARWILDNGRIVLATVGQFNVPSARTLRSVGLQYTFMDIKGLPGPFKVPPQPLGRPYPEAQVYDYYPRWAINDDILPKPD